MDNILKILNALSDEVRLRIVNILLKKELCVCEIQEVLKMSEPRISRHLKILRDAEIVKCKRDGKWCYYHISKNEYMEKLLSYLFNKVSNDRLFVEDIKKTANTIGVCRI